MIVIVLVPIPICVPSLSVFIPPAVGMSPAPFAGGDQFSALRRYFRAVPAVFLSGFVQFMIDVNDTLLAVILCA